MAEDRVERRLAAIFTADVVGYSRLVRANEEDALAAVGALISEVIQPAVAEHRGRIFKKMGDAVLAEFASTVDAVRCATAVQHEIAARGAATATERRIAFRIGVHVGDVVADGDDIHGDGVNVAVRIEGLATANGICISEDVFRQVEGRVEAGFEDIGPQRLKNIDSPIRVYRLHPEAAWQGRVVTPLSTRLRRLKWPAVAVVTFIVALVVARQFGVFPIREAPPEFDPASLERMAFPLPEKPSIAVLPFDNLSGDPSQEYFSDGVSENIITTLSKIPNVFVIARNSTFTYKGEPVKVQQVAEEMGVRYVLEGSVQRSGNRVRINAQLVDALSGRHLWADRYDREVGDIFVLQDEITQQVVTALQVELMEGEQARVWRGQTDNTGAYEHYLRGLEQWRRLTMEGNAKAQQLFEKSVALDAGFASAWVELARTHYLAARFGWSDDPARSTALASELAQNALAVDDAQADAYAMLSNVAILKRQHEQALAHCEQALTLNPKSEALAHCARNLSYMDRPEDALALIKRAMRLSPYYPGWYLCIVGNAHRVMGNYEEALAAYEGCRDRLPGSPIISASLAATYGLAGRDEAARATVAALLKRSPRYSVNQFAKAQLFKDPGETERLIAAVRKAGLPE